MLSVFDGWLNWKFKPLQPAGKAVQRTISFIVNNNEVWYLKKTDAPPVNYEPPIICSLYPTRLLNPSFSPHLFKFIGCQRRSDNV